MGLSHRDIGIEPEQDDWDDFGTWWRAECDASGLWRIVRRSDGMTLWAGDGGRPTKRDALIAAAAPAMLEELKRLADKMSYGCYGGDPTHTLAVIGLAEPPE